MQQIIDIYTMHVHELCWSSQNLGLATMITFFSSSEIYFSSSKVCSLSALEKLLSYPIDLVLCCFFRVLWNVIKL